MATLYVSALARAPGLFSVDTDSQVVSQVDDVPSSGLCLTADGLLRARFIHGECFIDTLSSGLVTSSIHLPSVQQAHDIVLDGGQLVVVDAIGNRVVWVDPTTGDITKEWVAGPVPDSWHLNSLVWDEGRLLVSHLARGDEYRGWFAKGGERLGGLTEVGTGAVVLDDLAAPHSPIRYLEDWLLCESFSATLTRIAPNGTRSILVLGGWPRGIALVGDTAWVGVSDSDRVPDALPPHGQSPGKVVAVDMAQWTVVAEVPLPSESVYGVVVG